MLEHFHFIRPYFLLLLVVVFWLMWRLYQKTKNSNAWSQVGDPDLLFYLLVGRDKKESKFPIVLMFIVGVLLVVAIAGPAWEKLPQAVYKKEAARVFVLDLSRSMDATDVVPTRASRAKLKLIDLLKASHEGQVALIVYAAEPHIVSPLTDDAETIIAMIPSLSPEIMPAQGSRVDRAIIRAAKLLKQAGSYEGEIILISDGVNGAKANDAVEKIAAEGYTLNVLGVGTEQGSPIPIRQRGFLKDASGAIVIPKLDRASLKTLALAGSGSYMDLAVDDADVAVMIRETLHANLEMNNPLTREVDLWQDEGHWFLLLALPFAALGFRRGWLIAVVFTVSYFPSNELYAYEWKDLWSTKDQQASELLSTGDAEKAAEMYKNNDWRGAAYYRHGNYEQAADAFSQGDSAEATYNRANALAKQGKLDEAIAAYEEVLTQQPEHQDAIFNHGLVKHALANQKQKPAGDKSQAGDDEQNPDQEQQSEQEKSDSGQSDSEQSEANSSQSSAESGEDSQDEQDVSEQEKMKPSDETKAEEEQAQKQAESSDESKEQDDAQEKEMTEEPSETETQAQKEIRQATQQWLRRIPDDPGGLLREKFSRQYQRQRQNQQTENPW